MPNWLQCCNGGECSNCDNCHFVKVTCIDTGLTTLFTKDGMQSYIACCQGDSDQSSPTACLDAVDDKESNKEGPPVLSEKQTSSKRVTISNAIQITFSCLTFYLLSFFIEHCRLASFVRQIDDYR